VGFNQNGAAKLPIEKPVVYRIPAGSGKTNCVGIAKGGRVQERIREHLDTGEIPGAKVRIEQMSSIQEAKKRESDITSRTRPKHNEKGK
jgi:hypothetical protein